MVYIFWSCRLSRMSFFSFLYSVSPGVVAFTIRLGGAAVGVLVTSDNDAGAS